MPEDSKEMRAPSMAVDPEFKGDPTMAQDPNFQGDPNMSTNPGVQAPISQRDLDLIIQTLQASRMGPGAPQMMETADQVNQRVTPEQYQQQQQPQQDIQFQEPPSPQQATGSVSIKDIGRQESEQQKQAPAFPLTKGYAGKAYKSGLEGIKDEATQQALKDVTASANAQIKEEAEVEVYGQYLDDLDDAEKRRNELYGDAQMLAKQFVKGNIDPNRWWGSRSTGQKIAIGIGAFLSGFGGSDAVINMVENAIDNDIDAQKKSFELKGAQVKNLYSMADKMYGDRVKKADMVKLTYLEVIKNKLEATMAQAKTGDAKSKIANAVSGLQFKIAEMTRKLEADELKARQEIKKEQKVGAEQVKNARNIKVAQQQFGEAVRQFKQNVTFSKTGFGQNEYQVARANLAQTIGYIFSGANVGVEERKVFIDSFPKFTDTKQQQATKLRNLSKMVDTLVKSVSVTNEKELKKFMGSGGARNPKFKPVKVSQ